MKIESHPSNSAVSCESCSIMLPEADMLVSQGHFHCTEICGERILEQKKLLKSLNLIVE